MKWLALCMCLVGLAVVVIAVIVPVWRFIQMSIYDPHDALNADSDDGVWTDIDMMEGSMPIAHANAPTILFPIDPAADGAISTPTSPPPTSNPEQLGVDP